MSRGVKTDRSAAEQGSRADAVRKRPVLRQIPAGIWTLGFVSMFMDTSSEMIHALLPIYLVTVLGASATIIVPTRA